MSLYAYGRFQLVHHPTEPETGRRLPAGAADYAKETHFADSVEEIVAAIATHVDALRGTVPAGTDPHDDSYYASFVHTVRENTELHTAQIVAPDQSVWWWLKLV